MFPFFRRKKPDAPAAQPAVAPSDAPPASTEAEAPQALQSEPDTAHAASSNADSTALDGAALDGTEHTPDGIVPPREPTAAPPLAVEPAPTMPDARDAASLLAGHERALIDGDPLDSHPADSSAPADAALADGSQAGSPAAAAGKSGWRERLRNSGFARSVGGLFSRNPKLDDELLDEIETALLTADVGVGATGALVDGLRKRMKAREFADARALLTALRAELLAMLAPVAQPLRIDPAAKPFVVLTVGVNGVGKTTTIGKLAHRFKGEGRSLMLAAGDTFRAAAVAQLQAWGQRNGVTVIAQGQNADPASVAFDALQAAKARGTEVLIADTAGRLHTQQGLMAELGKIKRVLGKLDASAPHEVLMVIDGTTGQNALSQLRQFHAAAGVTGLVVTKLDGTAKGGVIFALAREFGIPIRYAGIGERPEDLRVFDAEAFVDALLPERLGA